MKSPDAELASAYTRFMEGSEAAGLELVAGVQARIAESESRNWPLGVELPDDLDPLPDDPMRVDIDDAADRMDGAVADLMKAIGQ